MLSFNTIFCVEPKLHLAKLQECTLLTLWQKVIRVLFLIARIAHSHQGVMLPFAHISDGSAHFEPYELNRN